MGALEVKSGLRAALLLVRGEYSSDSPAVGGHVADPHLDCIGGDAEGDGHGVGELPDEIPFEFDISGPLGGQ